MQTIRLFDANALVLHTSSYSNVVFEYGIGMLRPTRTHTFYTATILSNTHTSDTRQRDMLLKN